MFNFYDEFQSCYWKIVNELNFNHTADCKARDIISNFFEEKLQNWSLETCLIEFSHILIRKKLIFVYGCGPSLESTVNMIIDKFGKGILKNAINLTADGATTLLRELKIPVDATFTDLDGILPDDFDYPYYVIVHAHGDNINQLYKYKKQIIQAKNIIPTTQVKPMKNTINPGGFTDGDRILFFIKSILDKNQKIILIGMDFSTIVGKFSKPHLTKNKKASLIKLKKLEYAQKLMEWVARMVSNDIYLLNSNAVLKNIKPIDYEEIVNL